MKAVIFDLDGVIVDTMDLHHEASRRSFSEAGLVVSKGELKKMDTMRSKEAFKHFFELKTDQEIEEMVSKKYVFLKKSVSGIKPFSGFFEFFFQVKGKYPLAIVSSSRRDFVEFILKEIGEENSFKIIVGAEDVSKGKPDPEGYLKAAKELGVEAEQCLVLEDSLYGIKSAKAAGMKCIAVTTTYDKNFLLDADLIVGSLSEISLEKAKGLFDA